MKRARIGIIKIETEEDFPLAVVQKKYMDATELFFSIIIEVEPELYDLAIQWFNEDEVFKATVIDMTLKLFCLNHLDISVGIFITTVSKGIATDLEILSKVSWEETHAGN